MPHNQGQTLIQCVDYLFNRVPRCLDCSDSTYYYVDSSDLAGECRISHGWASAEGPDS